MIKKLFITLTFMLSGIFFMVPVVSAVDLLAPACNAPSSSTCDESKKTGNPIYGPNGIINKGAQLVAIIAGIASVFMIIIAGIRFITANGDSSKIAGARSALIYAGVGLVVTAIAGAITIFLADRLL